MSPVISPVKIISKSSHVICAICVARQGTGTNDAFILRCAHWQKVSTRYAISPNISRGQCVPFLAKIIRLRDPLRCIILSSQ